MLLYMDKLTTFILMCILFLCGPVVATILLIMYIFIGSINVNIFLLLWFLCTNCMYNFMDIMYIIFSTCILTSCGIVYLYDITYDDITKMDNRFNTLTKLHNKYKKIIFKLLINKLNISNEYSEKYNNLSNLFDNLYVLLFDILYKLRLMTQNIYFIKNIYQIYDNSKMYITEFKKNKSYDKFTYKSFADIISGMSSDEKSQISDIANNIISSNDIFSNINVDNLMSEIREHKKQRLR